MKLMIGRIKKRKKSPFQDFANESIPSLTWPLTYTIAEQITK